MANNSTPEIRPELVLYHGDCIDVLARLDADSVDAVVTDPPYGLEFMGKDWDRFRIDDPGRLGRPRTGEGVGAQGGFKHGTLTGESTPGVVIGGGRKPTTNRCVTCGKRDQFRKRHHPCGDGVWRAEVIDPHAAPPTMLAFQEWCRVWATQCLRVLKPGGHLLAFGGTRTYHRMVAGVEDAGFEIRDTIAWLYGQGFPKSLDVAKAIDANLDAEREITRAETRPLEPGAAITFDQRSSTERERRDTPATPEGAAWQGWGTALKPAHEPIVVARKPLRGSVAQTVLEFGTGGLNIDATRIPISDEDRLTIDTMGGYGAADAISESNIYNLGVQHRGEGARAHELGRHPANVALDERAAAMLDAQSGELKAGGRVGTRAGLGFGSGAQGTTGPRIRLEGGGASRFFYTAKASTRERNKGLSHLPLELAPTLQGADAYPLDRHGIPRAPLRKRANVHPTVKPLDLMHWLVRLVAPPDGVVLDPFAGSGTTGVACRLEHVRCILIEADAEYLPIIAGRLGVQAMTEGEMRLERTRIPDPELRKRERARFACPHCDRRFTDRSLYARHWRAEHDPRRPPTEGDAA